MRWTVRSTAQGYEAKWWPDEGETPVVRFKVPENSVCAWRWAARKWLESNRVALPASAAFEHCEFGCDLESEKNEAFLERVAFCKFVLALQREDQALQREDQDFQALTIVEKHLAVFRGEASCWWMFWALDLRRDGRANSITEEVDDRTWVVCLEKIYPEDSRKAIVDFLSHQDLLREILHRIVYDGRDASAPLLVVRQNYAALLKATIHFLDTNQMSRLSRRYRPRLYALLVENEALPLEERREYLERVFVQKLPYAEERSLLLDVILPALLEKVRDGSETGVAVQTLASLTAQHYLNQYALDNAIVIWREWLTVERDLLLQAILSLYRKPTRYLGAIGLLILASFLPFLGMNLGAVGFLPAALLLLLSLLLALYGLITVGIRLIRQRGFSYLELFLPRLLGSIIVGLSILGLENTIWETSLNMPWLNWGLVVFASFTGALAYFFLDVHKNMRLLPAEDNSDGSQATQPPPLNAMARSVRAAFKIFAIGVLEALGLTILIASLLPLATTANAVLVVSYSWLKIFANDLLFIFEMGGDKGLVLAYSPKIAVLWAGLALLIGAFAQLLWQDRQITAS